jgi:excinuclease UvrABC ATPase subunit
MHVRVFLSRYRSYDLCPACGGARFKPETLRYRIENRNIAQIYALNVDQAQAFFEPDRSRAGTRPRAWCWKRSWAGCAISRMWGWGT